jgi:hypothetical protein
LRESSGYSDLSSWAYVPSARSRGFG